MRIHFIQHVHFETPGYLLEWAQAEQHTISFTRIFENVEFPSVENIDGLIVMGGPMGVYEEATHPWLRSEKTFIRNVIDAGKKVMGICLGAQLVAEALGAKVYPNKEKEIGWWPVQTIRHEQVNWLTGHLPEQFTTFHWHGDTFDLPAGAVHLLATAACPNQGFLFNDQVAGLQFHMEATAPLVRQMLEHGKAELVCAPYIQPEAEIMEAVLQHTDNNRAYLAGFVNKFLK